MMENTLLLVSMTAQSTEQLRTCAAAQRKMIAYLMTNYNMTYSQILFPYADERNVFTGIELDEKPLFGTHALFSGVEKEWLERAAEESSVKVRIKEIKRSRAALESSLRAKGFCGVMLCGTFALLPGDCADWQIRDAARKFASFADIVETKTKGGVVGILGGSLALCCDDDFKSKAKELYASKIGGNAKVRVIK